MSNEEAAETILDGSVRVGFGFVRESESGPDIRRQEVDIVLPLKGRAGSSFWNLNRLTGPGKWTGFFAGFRTARTSFVCSP